MRSFKSLRVFLLFGFTVALLVGCQKSPEALVNGSFDDPAVAKYLKNHYEISQTIMSSKGKLDPASFTKLHKMAQEMQGKRTLQKNMSSGDKAKYTAYVKQYMQEMQAHPVCLPLGPSCMIRTSVGGTIKSSSVAKNSSWLRRKFFLGLPITPLSPANSHCSIVVRSSSRKNALLLENGFPRSPKVSWFPATPTTHL